MTRNWTRENILSVASQMFEDGTTGSERYSSRSWKARGWPEVDSPLVYRALDAQIKFLRTMEEYEGGLPPEYRSEAILQRPK